MCEDDDMLNNVAQVYPNPAAEQFTIQLKNDIATKVEIFNQYGEIVLSQPLTEKITNLEHGLVAGLYIVKLTGGHQTLNTKPLIKYNA